MRISRPFLLSCSVLLAGLTGCGGGEPSRPNVVIVLTDTLRSDRLGCYGNTRGLTPYLDALAEEGVRFEHAASHAPWTLPSIASLLTSLHPAEHGAGGRLPNFRALDSSVTTIAGVLDQAGWVTHAIGNVAFLNDWTGVLREFDSTDVEAPSSNVEMRSAERTTDAALEWIDAHQGGASSESPFFMFLHYFDPHAVYAPPQPFRQRFAGRLDQNDDSWVFGTRLQMMGLRSGTMTFEPPIIRRAEKLYDGEVAYLDSQVGRFVDELRARGLGDNTLLVITSDHGEEFLDHDGFEHGHTLYDELTRIPLILHYPSQLEPTVVRPRVAHVDVAPTILTLAGLESHPQFVGRSLLEYLVNPDAPPRSVIAHGNMWAEAQTSWKSGNHKLILYPGGKAELFDLEADPGEQDDLASLRPELVQELTSELDTLMAAMRALGRGEAAVLDAETQDSLRESGYAGGDEEED